METQVPIINFAIREDDCVKCHESVDTTLNTGAHQAHLKSHFKEMQSCEFCHPDNSRQHSPIDSVVLLKGGFEMAASTACDSCHAAGIQLAKDLWHVPEKAYTDDSSNCKICHAADNTLETGAHKPHLLSKIASEKIDCGHCHPKPENKHSLIDSVVLMRDIMDFKQSKSCDSCHSCNTDLAKELWPQKSETYRNDTGYCRICHVVDGKLETGSHKGHITTPRLKLDNCTACHPDNLEAHSKLDDKVLFSDSTDLSTTLKCDTCHGSGTGLAKLNWQEPAAWKLDTGYCEGCHDGSSVINGNPLRNYPALSKKAGHGATETYELSVHGSRGPGYRCQVCHDPDAPGHVDSIKGDMRLKIDNKKSALCLDCHAPGQKDKGTLGFLAVLKGSRHAGAVTGRYDTLSHYNYECATCHDAHGTSNLAMVLDTIDGGLGAGPYPVVFRDTTDYDPEYLEADSGGKVDGVCDVCHPPGKEPHAFTEKGKNHDEGHSCRSCHLHTVSFDTASTYFDDFWIHPEKQVWKHPDSLEIGVAEISRLAVSVVGNLQENYNVTRQSSWSNSNPAVFAVNDSGMVTGLSPGTGMLMAVFDTLQHEITVIVKKDTSFSKFNTLEILPAGASVSVNDSLQLSGRVVLPGGAGIDVTNRLSWASNNSAAAQVSQTGMVYGKGPGIASILAFDGVSGMTAITLLTVR